MIKTGPRERWSVAGVILLWVAAGGFTWAAGSPPAKYRITLDNGLVVLYRPNPGTLTMATALFIKASARVEKESTAGLRSLAQAALLDIADASGRSLEERVAHQAMLVTQQATADHLETIFQGTSDQLDEALAFTRELLDRPVLDPQRLRIRQAQAARAVEERRELAETFALDLAAEQLYRNTPCAWSAVGTRAVATLQARQLEDFWRTRVAPNNAVLAISGPFSWETCRTAAQVTLGPILPRRIFPEPEMPRRTSLRAVVHEPWQGANAVVMIAARCPGPDSEGFAAAAIVNAVLGAGEGSRLFRTLREEHGWVYTVSQQLIPSRYCGLIAVQAVCAPEKAADVFRTMQAEVARLVTEPPTATEIARAQAYLTSGYVLGHQRSVEVAHYLGLFEILVPGRSDTNLPELLAEVTPVTVARAAMELGATGLWVQVGGERPS